MRVLTYKEIETQSQEQGCGDGIEYMLLHRREITTTLVDLDGSNNNNAEDNGEKQPEELPQTRCMALLGGEGWIVMRVKALGSRPWRNQKIGGG